MSKIRRFYFARLVGSVILAAIVLYLYIWRRSAFSVLQGWAFFSGLSPLHMLWVVWVIDMIGQLVPVQKNIALGSLKMYRHRFRPLVDGINYKALKEHIVVTT